jgi:outer membrane lipoprotein-sorting protein
VSLATYGSVKGPWLELTRKSQGIPAQPTIMRIMLDEKTHLPARLEYRGYDDPKGYLTVRFANTRSNVGIPNRNLWK